MIDREKLTKTDSRIITEIAQRAVKQYGEHGVELDMQSTEMDVAAVHINCGGLRLLELLSADDFNFAHDITGIANHLDREKGVLTGCFLPRFSAKGGK